MQSVASVLLFQGIKANRTYAKVRQEYANDLFLKGHDLATYHFAAYANLRFEQLWKTNRIDKSYRIYKFYILTGIGMVLSTERDKIPLYGKTAKARASAMSAYISDDDNLEKLIAEIISKIDKVMRVQTVPTGELRDFIKKESIQLKILKALKKIDNPLV